jgi:hypothetical protein
MLESYKVAKYPIRLDGCGTLMCLYLIVEFDVAMVYSGVGDYEDKRNVASRLHVAVMARTVMSYLSLFL